MPRLVSEAGTSDSLVPCLLITQSLDFSNLHAGCYRLRCGVGGYQGVPANCGMHISRLRFFPREAPITPTWKGGLLKSVALPTELPSQGLFTINWAIHFVCPRRPDLALG